ncbi:MAG TPA: type VI secretion system tip protein VgrG, partial [Polyangiaceae bacterium]|nr:type VI secretion system tip protein VgrG [Polyangiaceae bacterium]
MLIKAAATLRTEFFVTQTVAHFQERHELNQPPFAEVEVWLDDSLPMDQVVGTQGELSYGALGAEPRLFRGIVDSIELVAHLSPDPEDLQLVYRLRICSVLSLLERSVASEIFQEKTVQQIVSAVLEAHGILSAQQVWRLNGSYPTREYCVRYQESALAFVNRLLEAEGIGYSVEPMGDDQEQVVFFDRSSAAPIIDSPESLPVRDASRLQDAGEAIYGVDDATSVVSGAVALRDYDFEHPTLDLTASAVGDAHTDLEVYDYPGGYITPADGSRLAQLRLEELAAGSAVRTIETDAMHIRVGRKLVIDSDDAGSSEWFVVALENQLKAEEATDQHNHFECLARLIPL